MSAPRISVIIPVHNRAGLVGQAIDSVLGQGFADFELIAVDDGSSDGSEAVVAAYADPRVRLVRLEVNQGSNAARNAGIRAARGEILCFLDSDDLYLPAKLETVAALFAADPELDVAVDSFVRVNSPHAKRSVSEVRNPDTGTAADFCRALFTRELAKATSAISVRRDAAIRAGLFDEKVRQRQDFDFLIRLADCAKCRSISDVLWIKGWTGDRLTSRERFVPATIELVRRHPQYLTDRVYRGGLARDIARNGYLLLREGKWRTAFAGVALAAGAFGLWRTAGLVLRGTGQAVGKNLKRRPKRAATSRNLSPAEQKALATARNRASARS